MKIDDLKNEKLREALGRSSKFNSLSDEKKEDFLLKLKAVEEMEEVDKMIKFLEDDQEVEEMKTKSVQAKKEFFLKKLGDLKVSAKKAKVEDDSQVERSKDLDNVSKKLIK